MNEDNEILTRGEWKKNKDRIKKTCVVFQKKAMEQRKLLYKLSYWNGLFTVF